MKKQIKKISTMALVLLFGISYQNAKAQNSSNYYNDDVYNQQNQNNNNANNGQNYNNQSNGSYNNGNNRNYNNQPNGNYSNDNNQGQRHPNTTNNNYYYNDRPVVRPRIVVAPVLPFLIPRLLFGGRGYYRPRYCGMHRRHW